MKQIYTSLWVLDGDNKQAQFWWDKAVNALIDFDFGDLCQIIPTGEFTNGKFDIYFILEKDLRTLLKEKEISEENYTIDYGTMFGGRILIVGEPVDDMIRDEFEKQRQKGLYIVRKSK